MTLTLDWTDTLDALICEAIKAGRVTGELSGTPDEVIESGLAHIFFYDDTVYKLYKTHADKDHFIKGVLAPTLRRKDFLERDFALNQHFSSEVYRQLHSVWYENGVVTVGLYDGSSIYTLVEMNRLDFDTNLHERLLKGEITDDELYALGFETARAIDTCPIVAPESVNWYDLATERVGLLKQFVEWLPSAFGEPVKQARVIEALYEHLETYRHEYETISGTALAVNVDNHDENVFFINGQPQFIDLLPPMSSWWFGLPYANLSNLMANIETLHSEVAAERVKEGYFAYHGIDTLPAHRLGFTHAFAYLISIAHFGSVPGKEAVVEKYIERLPKVAEWLR